MNRARFQAALFDSVLTFVIVLPVLLIASWTNARVLAIFGSERRCLHDHLAGTKVVQA